MKFIQRAVAFGLAAALIQALMLIAFAWPASHIAPRDLPIAVSGPQAGVVVERLEQQSPGAFEPTVLPDENAVREAITDREVYGAIVTGGAPRLLVASAASPVVAQQLTQVAQRMAGAPAAPVEDVVAADPDDPRGAGFGAMALPLVMAGIAASVLLTLMVDSTAGRLVGALTFGVAGGLLSMVIVQGWLSLVPGDYLTLSAVAGLISFAVAGSIVGLSSVIGRAGIALGALTMLLVGNPFSAATSAPELLPRPWGTIGQLLPPGAGATLVRSVAFFDGARAGGPLLVLLGWAAAGLVLLGIGMLRELRSDRSAEVATPKAESVPAAV